MSNATTAYPFDPSGLLASNLITAEHQTISPPELSEFHFIIPAASPFFAESMVLVHLPSMRTLVEGVDYMPTHYFHDASLACAKPIYGSLTFNDNTLANAVRMSYQTVGGDWVLDSSKIIEILSNKLVNPRKVTWEQVADLPYAFPTIDHAWHLDDMVGMSEVVAVLAGIRDALMATGEGGLIVHVADHDNPHSTTKEHVGLGSVENYAVASIAEAQAGTASNRYLTVLRGAQLVQALIGTALDTHVNNSANPHNTTKEHVGLGSVENYTVATIAEAQAGAVNTKYMTPVRTSQAITAMVGNKVDTHIARTDNPHDTTKAHVGLGAVANYAVADVVAARLGTSNELYMTPAMTREAIDSIALQGVTDHINNVANPHNTTKTQVGLGNVLDYSIASQVEAEEGSLNSRYMTPLRSRQLVQVLAIGPLNTHIGDDDNPHATTKTHVGLGLVNNYSTADNAQAVAGVATNLYMTPAATKALIESISAAGGGDAILAAHLADLANPHETNKAQVGLGSVENFATASLAQAQAGAASNLYITPAGSSALITQLVGNAFAAHAADIANPHEVTAAQTGAFTQAEVNSLLTGKLDIDGVAEDSSKLDGRTYVEVIEASKTVEFFPEVRIGNGDTWTLLGELTYATDQGLFPTPDIVAEITGGDGAAFGASSSFLVRLTPKDLTLSSATMMTEQSSLEIVYGYVTTVVGGNTTVSLYMRAPRHRHVVTVAPISQVDRFFINTNTVLEAAPAGIQYLPVSTPAFARTRPTFGDLAFGDLPNTQNLEQTTGSLVEWVSVVDSDSDELIVQAIQNSLREEYPNFIPWSAANNNYLYDDLPVLDAWGWNSTEEAILLDTNTVNGNVMYTSPDSSVDYSFEVEIGSTNAAANGAGVLAAVVNVGDRPYAISVVRTPGGMTQITGVPVNFAYKLKTIALHIGQRDGFDLGSANGSLLWSDTDLPNDTRNPALFVPAGNGWDTAGKVRIRVVRAANILTIDVTNFGSTAYEAGEQVVIDFNNVPALQQFVDTPSSWGLISVRQPNVTFKVLNRPNLYRDYVRIGVAADNDKQRLYRHNGTVWQMSYLGISNPRVRPNRLYFSDWNGVLYQSQRNGRLRPILVEAYMRA